MEFSPNPVEHLYYGAGFLRAEHLNDFRFKKLFLQFI